MPAKITQDFYMVALNDLEEARHLLTADEYDKKRADILASV